MRGCFTKPEAIMSRETRLTAMALRDILSAFQKALSRLPADQEIHSTQRAVVVLDRALEKLEMR